ncbi:FAD binding domain of DNA photolyase-domain-containing protein [Gymnopilus junonius]|uniref:FAD binding domain of DNA photolyase-domain-containing protein n=1 Tax=Gymnopilus junonius TaxID=109634 RepID=A0A9P5TV46_GYMJU|nr:FAD binding domain of DNA photolyase-domain-containing protein [Gymnopilus junonius]
MRAKTVHNPKKGKSVIYWMRMADLRIHDNRALSRASVLAQEDSIPLIILFIICPQDYLAHGVGARRIDFMLRNLRSLKESFFSLNIPFLATTQAKMRGIPSFVLSFCEQYGANTLFANIEYEVDELRRDIKVCESAFPKGIQVIFEHDKCIIEPGILLTKQGKPYTVYSPYQRSWLSVLNNNVAHHLEECSSPKANDESIKSSELLVPIFDSTVPFAVEGFELADWDQIRMRESWPEGEVTATQILERFLTTKKRSSQLGAVDPLSHGSENCPKFSRIAKYASDRDQIGSDTTSRLSPYLASGVISVRECARATMQLSETCMDTDKSSGIKRWMQEIAWRDFYINILASFPRVCMGCPYLEKFSDVVWENSRSYDNVEVEAENVQKWKTGMTGVPIVDAAMRCIKTMGWVHNRARMIAAMYLSKDLMIDWRVGEKYFMEVLVDGDFASNNGGWQWCASTGTDPCPYFRIFNPHTQSLKADPSGNFIHHWVPELRKVRGPDLHDPSSALADKLGYPRPIILHSEARERALRRYKNPGNM